MTTVATSNVTSSNGIDIFPYALKFANNASLLVQDTIKLANDNPIINTSTLVIGNSSINSTLITIPSLTVGSFSFSGSANGGIVNTQIFTANGTWTKPSALSGNEQVFIMAWGAGGSGFGGAYSGGGGACVIGTCFVSEIDSTVSVTVGSGVNNAPGGNSIFASTNKNLIATGGGVANSSKGGGGGGLLGVATSISVGGDPLGGSPSEFGGGHGANNAPGNNGSNSIFGGGGGGLWQGLGGKTIYGGGGGGNTSSTLTSVFGGLGAQGSTQPTTPGGGGQGFGAGLAAGARGEVRVWVIK